MYRFCEGPTRGLAYAVPGYAYTRGWVCFTGPGSRCGALVAARSVSLSYSFVKVHSPGLELKHSIRHYVMICQV